MKIGKKLLLKIKTIKVLIYKNITSSFLHFLAGIILSTCWNITKRMDKNKKKENEIG